MTGRVRTLSLRSSSHTRLVSHITYLTTYLPSSFELSRNFEVVFVVEETLLKEPGWIGDPSDSVETEETPGSTGGVVVDSKEGTTVHNTTMELIKMYGIVLELLRPVTE